MHLRVICALIEQDGRLLITQRSPLMAQPLLWEFPGGKVEPGETEQECLIREISEELNLKVLPQMRLTPVLQPLNDGRTLELIPYTCSLLGGTLRLAEHQAFRWAAPRQLLAFDWCAPDIPIVEEYLRLQGLG